MVPAEPQPPGDARVPRRRGRADGRSASCWRPGAGSGSSTRSTPTCRCAGSSRALLRGPVRRQRAPVDDRRRRAAGHAARRRTSAPRTSRSRPWCSTGSPASSPCRSCSSLGFLADPSLFRAARLDRAAVTGGATLAVPRGRSSSSPVTPASRAVHRARELDALHRRDPRRRRPAAPRAATSPSARSPRPSRYQFLVVAAVYCAVHTIGLHGPDRGGARLRPRRRHRPGAADLHRRASASARACSSCCCTPLGATTAQAVARRAALVRHAAHRQPRRRARVRHRGPHPGVGRAATRDAGAPTHRRTRSRTEPRRLHRRLPGAGCCATAPSSTGGPRSLRSASSTSCTRRSGTSTRAAQAAASPHALQIIGLQQLARHLPRAQPPAAGRCTSRRSSSPATTSTGRCTSSSRPVVLIYLFRKWRDDYPLWRNTLAVATGHRAASGSSSSRSCRPACSPAHFGFVDTLAKDPAFWSFNSGAINKISNQFAAMPSVHCAGRCGARARSVPRLKHRWAKSLAGGLPRSAPSPRSS